MLIQEQLYEFMHRRVGDNEIILSEKPYQKKHYLHEANFA